jgi:hypothetical protein
MQNDPSEICRRFDTEYLPPDAEQKVGIALGSLGNVPLHAVRIHPENGTSGWYIMAVSIQRMPTFISPFTLPI